MTLQSPSRLRFWGLAGARLLGALALLTTGGIHLEQYIVANYRTVPTIGPLFLLNFIAGTVLGLYFVVPARAKADPVRWWLDMLAALSGWGVGALGLIALFISEHTLLFGFMEHGYRRDIVIAIVAEGVTVLALSAFMALRYQGRSSARKPRGFPPGYRAPVDPDGSAG